MQPLGHLRDRVAGQARDHVAEARYTQIDTSAAQPAFLQRTPHAGADAVGSDDKVAGLSALVLEDQRTTLGPSHRRVDRHLHALAPRAVEERALQRLAA